MSELPDRNSLPNRDLLISKAEYTIKLGCQESDARLFGSLYEILEKVKNHEVSDTMKIMHSANLKPQFLNPYLLFNHKITKSDGVLAKKTRY